MGAICNLQGAANGGIVAFMSIRVSLLFVLVCSCNRATTSPMPDMTSGIDMPDMTSGIDMADPYLASSDGGACQQSLAAWCAKPDAVDGQCVMTLAQAMQASSWPAWCPDGGLSTRVLQSSCGAFTEIVQSGADFSTSYVYDATGNLVAVLEYGYQRTDCVAGPSRFAAPTCTQATTTICGS
jgi:hypothetical protein